jgi:8-oxo-dGTP pyrophosphatase MutT (NUDIX family)
MEGRVMVMGTHPKLTMNLQATAIPFRRRRGRLEFCLITTRRGKWIFPKGIVDPGETREQAALKEAFEEAGLHGHIVGPPVGSYPLAKFGKEFEVIAMLMEVTQCDAHWMEQQMRRRRWVSTQDAFQLLEQPELHDLLHQAIARLDKQPENA